MHRVLWEHRMGTVTQSNMSGKIFKEKMKRDLSLRKLGVDQMEGELKKAF